MSVADPNPQMTRGPKTIFIPCSQEQYERIVDDPALFREWLDRQIDSTPELLPPEIHRGYRIKDAYTSRKTGWKNGISSSFWGPLCMASMVTGQPVTSRSSQSSGMAVISLLF